MWRYKGGQLYALLKSRGCFIHLLIMRSASPTMVSHILQFFFSAFLEIFAVIEEMVGFFIFFPTCS